MATAATKWPGHSAGLISKVSESAYVIHPSLSQGNYFSQYLLSINHGADRPLPSRKEEGRKERKKRKKKKKERKKRKREKDSS